MINVGVAIDQVIIVKEQSRELDTKNPKRTVIRQQREQGFNEKKIYCSFLKQSEFRSFKAQKGFKLKI